MTADDDVLRTGIELTWFGVVADQDRAREWWVGVLGAEVVQERDPVLLRAWGVMVILNLPGGPTPDKPAVELVTPDPERTSAFLDIRVPDIEAFHRVTSARGAEWLTAPIPRGPEIRGYLRDPDGHLIEVGQSVRS